MGVRSSQPRSPNLNKTDGHLLEYFRNALVLVVELMHLQVPYRV